MCAKLGGRFTCLCTTLSLDLAVFAHPGQCQETIRREPVPRSLASLHSAGQVCCISVGLCAKCGKVPSGLFPCVVLV